MILKDNIQKNHIYYFKIIEGKLCREYLQVHLYIHTQPNQRLNKEDPVG